MQNCSGSSCVVSADLYCADLEWATVKLEIFGSY